MAKTINEKQKKIIKKRGKRRCLDVVLQKKEEDCDIHISTAIQNISKKKHFPFQSVENLTLQKLDNTQNVFKIS